jgi:hypothetical protein
MDFGKAKLKILNSTKRDGNSNSTIHSNLELAMTNSDLEYPMKDSATKSIGVDSRLFKVESSQANSSSKSTHQDSIPKFVGANFGIEVIMINCFHPNQQTDAKRTKIHLYFRNGLYNQHRV